MVLDTVPDPFPYRFLVGLIAFVHGVTSATEALLLHALALVNVRIGEMLTL